LALRFYSGFENQNAAADKVTLAGAAAYSTARARTGAASLRCNVVSAGNGSFFSTTGTGAGYMHFGWNIATLPTVERRLFGTTAAGTINVRLQPSGQLAVYLAGVLIGTSAIALAPGGWHWIGIRNVAGGGPISWLQIDGVDAVVGAAAVTNQNNLMGFPGTEATAADAYWDDMAVDDAGFLPPGWIPPRGRVIASDAATAVAVASNAPVSLATPAEARPSSAAIGDA